MGVRRVVTKSVEVALVPNILATEWPTDHIETAVGMPAGEPSDEWWDSFDRRTGAPDGPAALKTHRTHNVTTETLHEFLPVCLDYRAASESDERPTLSIGTADAPTTSTTDTALDNPAAEFSVSQFNVTGRTIRFRTLLASQDANGLNITEAGILDPSGSLWNHGVFNSTISKDDTKVVTITVELSFQDVSEVGA